MSAAAGSSGGARVPACFRHFPAIVLGLSADGRVQASNGRLEEWLARPVVGHDFAELLDAPSSRPRWVALLSRAAEADADPAACVRELVLYGQDSLSEPRTFSLVRDTDAPTVFWLVEHPTDPRLDDLRERVVGVNSELANAQRDLVKERGRLAAALEQLEREYDVTHALAIELEARNTALARSNRALDEFAHVISHDLKAPLRGIANYAAWLDADLGATLPDESRAHLGRLRQLTDRMREMVDGVLLYARAGRARTPCEQVRVGELIDEVIALADAPAEVSITVSGARPTLFIRRVPLQQTLLNLLTNAVRYADPADPRVEITVRAAEQGHEFIVRDNGPGVPPAQRDGIWQLFRAVEHSSRPVGTGVGLAVVKRLVEAEGGSVGLADEPGGGATFRVCWPAHVADDELLEGDS